MRTLHVLVVGALLAISALTFRPADAKRRPPPQPAPAPAQWDSRGWQLLGEQQVGGKVDRDTIRVGRHEGRFTKLTLVVSDSDLELLDFTIHFVDRTRYEPKVAHYFKEGQRTRVLDLPPSEQLISHIDLKYRNLPGGGRARVQVWGWKVGDVARPPAPAPQPQWDARGWDLLGEQTVGGRQDRDTLRVGRREGRFSKLTLVVSDSDLELLDFTIHFADKTRYQPKLAHYFREGQRTRAIDLPPNGGLISHLDLHYRNLPGGGRAKVAVYGWKVGEAPAQWDSRGWTMLGEQKVNGRADRDRIVVGKHEGRFSKLTVVVLDSDLELTDLAIKFGRGRDWRPANVKHSFREGQRTRVIDFPGDGRAIKHIDLRYRNLPGGGAARVQVWAWQTEHGRGHGSRR